MWIYVIGMQDKDLVGGVIRTVFVEMKIYDWLRLTPLKGVYLSQLYNILKWTTVYVHLKY